MAILIASGTTVSTAANTTTASLVSGDYEFIGRGRVILVARGSATGMNVALSVGGIYIVNDQAIPYFGTTGALSTADHTVVNQLVTGGRINFKLRNTTGGALTTDYALYFEPAGK